MLQRPRLEPARGENRGPTLAATPLPKALIAESPYGNRDQRDAIFRVAESIRDGDGRYPALHAILGRELPRLRGRSRGGRLQTTDPAEMKALALGLDRDDTVIRRRLMQKMEFLTEAAAAGATAGDAVLRTYYAAHRER